MNQMTRLIASPADGFSARFTTAEFLRMAEAGAFEDWKVELVEGKLERMQQPHSNHAMRQAQLVIRLARVTAEERVSGEVGIDLGDATLLSCDVALLREPVATNRILRPDDLALVVEIAETTLDRDLGLKRRTYAAAGIPVYWVVDGARSVVHVHADPVEGEYVEVHTVRFGQPVAVPGADATIVLDQASSAASGCRCR